ncbi:hypothetical protein C5167_029202 [Papaver somniferum]|nr:hypothetical protein C5167_029202 [Papaver somniferum]
MSGSSSCREASYQNCLCLFRLGIS